MSTLSVRFRGICCHIDPANGEGFRKRTVLLRAQSSSEHHHGHAMAGSTFPRHIAYVECYASDWDQANSTQMNPSPVSARNNDLGQFIYFELDGESIELVGVRESSLTTLGSYSERIPRLQKVAPAFGALGSQYLGQAASMNPDEVGAVFDMPGGTLFGGTPEPFETGFSGNTQWAKRKLAQWVELQVVVEDPPRLRFTSFRTGETRELALKPGASLVTIGNETEDSIYGIPSPDGTGHFGMYYGLAANLPAERPTPEIFQTIGGGCGNANYP